VTTLKALIAGLALTLIWGSTQGEASRQSDRQGMVYASAETDANRGEWRQEQCRYQTVGEHRRWTDYKVAQTIHCAVDHWGVPGGDDGAICIAQRESGLEADSDNEDSTAAGVYQFLASTWTGAKQAFAMPWWRLRSSVYNARSNVIRAIRHVHAHWSWSAWAVDYLCGL
jgi:hypothetical protein